MDKFNKIKLKNQRNRDIIMHILKVEDAYVNRAY